MYKKLHNKEPLPSWKPLYAKGFLFPCVPERVIMLTRIVYDIQRRKRKPPHANKGGFLFFEMYALVLRIDASRRLR